MAGIETDILLDRIIPVLKNRHCLFISDGILICGISISGIKEEHPVKAGKIRIIRTII